MSFVMKPIGEIHSPFTDPAHTPIQPARSTATGRVEVYAPYVAGLKDLEGFSHVWLLYVLHRSAGYDLHVTPFLDSQLRGVFATRHPRRPNPIGLSLVQLKAVYDGVLEVEGIDVLDGTPLLDIKPYVPDFDMPLGTRAGWYETRSEAGNSSS